MINYYNDTLDKNVREAIRTAALKNSVTYETARKVIMNNFSWLRSSLSEAEYASYLMPRFGSFKYFVKKEEDPFRDAVNKYTAKTKVKDKKRYIPKDKEVDPKQKELVDQIVNNYSVDCSDKPYLTKHFKNMFWCIKDEGGWCPDYMLYFSNIDDLTKLKNYLENGLQEKTGEKQSV